MYSLILNILKTNYKIRNGTKKSYFVDENDAVVATFDEKSITMFYDFRPKSRVIWNHNGKVAISFIKDFNVNGEKGDLFYIEGLCGSSNDVMVHKDYAIETANNEELTINEKQKEFEKQSNGEKSKTFDLMFGCHSEGANFTNVSVFGTDSKLGNCGNLTVEDGLATFDICGELIIKKCHIASYDNLQVNVVSKNGTVETDNNEIYSYYREKNDWYYSKGYKTCNSDETRRYTERRKNSVIDANSINNEVQVYAKIPNFIVQRLNELYKECTIKSPNAIRLHMLRIIKEYLHNLQLAANQSFVKLLGTNIIDKFNFGLRPIDYKRQKKINI